jgi:hypothetical protein
MIACHRPADHKRRTSSKWQKALRRLHCETVAPGRAEHEAWARSCVNAVMDVGALRGSGHHQARARHHDLGPRPPTVETSKR